MRCGLYQYTLSLTAMTTSEIIQAWLPTCGWLFGPLLIIYIIRRALPHFARRWFTCAMFVPYALVICGFSMFVLMLFAASVGTSSVSDSTKMAVTLSGGVGEARAVTNSGKTAGLLPYTDDAAPAPLNGMHNRGGEWSGRDYVRACGTAIVAPFDGRVTRGGAGVKDSWNNTYMYIKDATGRYDMLIMHSDFYLSTGSSFKAGQVIGATNSIGYSSECHEHISLLDNGVEVDPERYRNVKQETAVAAPVPAIDLAGISQGLARFGYSENGGNPLRVSHYDPSLGGTNCDSDCSTMASGHKVAAWVGGQNGVYAAACPAEWPFGTRFELYGRIYQCQDRGGWIKTRQVGQWDPAMGGFIAAETYHWVDLLDSPPVPYGALVRDWRFVK